VARAGIRVGAPSVPDMMKVLTAVATKEGMALPEPAAARIANMSGRNMRR